MINVSREKNINYTDLIITHCIQLLNDHTIFHEYLLMCQFKKEKSATLPKNQEYLRQQQKTDR
jgi:hypothetical protein